MSFLLVTTAVFVFILYRCNQLQIICQTKQFKNWTSVYHRLLPTVSNKGIATINRYCLFQIIEFVIYNMEDNYHHRTHSTHHCINQIIDRILDITFTIIKNNRMNEMIQQQMPKDYLNYIGNVSVLLHSHRDPTSQKLFIKTITQPAESNSHQLHNPNPLRRIHKTDKMQEDRDSMDPKEYGRKQSICISHRSRMSGSRLPTRKFMSKRKIVDNSKLIPLNRASECQDPSEVYEDKITQLRKRKIKLQEAMKAFKDQEKPDKLFQSKKTKQNHLHFTTDFRGKIIAFNPKLTKARKNENNPLIIKFETLVESSRSWTNWGKVSSNTRRNLFLREGTNISQCDMN